MTCVHRYPIKGFYPIFIYAFIYVKMIIIKQFFPHHKRHLGVPMTNRVLNEAGNTIYTLELLQKDVLLIKSIQYESGHVKSMALEMLELMLSSQPIGSEFYVVFDFNEFLIADKTLSKEDSNQLKITSKAVADYFSIVADVHVTSQQGDLSNFNKIIAERSLPSSIYASTTVEDALAIIDKIRTGKIAKRL